MRRIPTTLWWSTGEALLQNYSQVRLLPLLLLVILRDHDTGRRMVVPLSLVVAAAWLTNAPSAVMVNYSLALLVVIMAITFRQPKLLLYGAFAVGLGAALAGFYLIPAALEEKWVNIAQVLAPGLRPQDNFLFTLINDVDHNRFNLVVSLVGASEVVLFTVAAFVSRRWDKDSRAPWLTLAAWGSAATLLMLPITAIFWQYLPKLRFVQLPWRWLLCLNVAFALVRKRGVSKMGCSCNDLLPPCSWCSGSSGTKCRNPGGTMPPISRKCTTSLRTAKAMKVPTNMFRWASMHPTSTRMLLESGRLAAGP